tara:strand:+ start:3226 stop:5367 length:2142 start_codon:yes stop_codon:yes gene_type:complete
MNKYFTIFFIFVFLLRHIIVLNADNNTYINTSNITYDEEKNIVELAENSKINIYDTNILVDRGIIDYNKDLIEVYGDFYLYQELNILSGKDLIGNTSMSSFKAKEVSYIYNNDLKIDSENVDRSDGNIIFYNNFLTPCELDGYFNCPTWSLRIDKTKYDIDKDKFSHYDSFLQIADYKVWYLPYFSHYGTKAPRQKGFLTPTIEFDINGDSGIVAPYYYPITESSDVVIRPKVILDNNLNYFDKYTLNTIINYKNPEGNLFIDMYNEKLDDKTNTYSSAKLNAKQILNKNNVLYFDALITNSVSTTRSINDTPSAFEDISLKLDSYNLFYKNDLMRSEISTVEALDKTNSGLIPLTPSIKYTNYILRENNLSVFNEINLFNIKRNESGIDKPSDSTFIKFNNSLIFNNKIKDYNLYNKINITGNFGDYTFKNNPTLNDNVFESKIILSSEGFLNYNKNLKPRFKIVNNFNLINDNIINEDSQALTFNYQNQFSDSRFYGTDLEDNSARIIYGFESNFNSFGHTIDLNLNQSYDFRKKSNYTKKINQDSNFSDLAFEAKTNLDNIFFKIDTRLDNRDLEKKEMNYSIEYSDIFDFNLEYNETDAQAFQHSSTNTQSLGMNIGRQLNDNIKLYFNSDMDLKNNYSPLKQEIKLSLFDECSKLEISYLDQRFNDNYNTKPNETISISFHMDYLGFFGYEQKSNLLFEETGEVNYGN